MAVTRTVSCEKRAIASDAGAVLSPETILCDCWRWLSNFCRISTTDINKNIQHGRRYFELRRSQNGEGWRRSSVCGGYLLISEKTLRAKFSPAQRDSTRRDKSESDNLWLMQQKSAALGLLYAALFYDLADSPKTELPGMVPDGIPSVVQFKLVISNDDYSDPSVKESAVTKSDNAIYESAVAGTPLALLSHVLNICDSRVFAAVTTVANLIAQRLEVCTVAVKYAFLEHVLPFLVRQDGAICAINAGSATEDLCHSEPIGYHSPQQIENSVKSNVQGINEQGSLSQWNAGSAGVEFAILESLLHIPTSFSDMDSEGHAAPCVALFCQLVLGKFGQPSRADDQNRASHNYTSRQTCASFLEWLASSSLAVPKRKAVQKLSDQALVRLLLTCMIFARALLWAKIESTSQDFLTSTEASNQFRAPFAEPKKSYQQIILARQSAVEVVLSMWNFRRTTRGQDRDDAFSSETRTTTAKKGSKHSEASFLMLAKVLESPQSSEFLRLGSTEKTSYFSWSGYAFRMSLCLMLGRELVFMLGDIGRISKLESLLNSFLEPSPILFWRILEAVELDVSPDEFLDIVGLHKGEDQSDDRLLVLYYLLQRARTVHGLSNAGDPPSHLEESLGVTLRSIEPLGRKRQRVKTPRIDSLVTSLDHTYAIDLQTMLLSVCPWPELMILLADKYLMLSMGDVQCHASEGWLRYRLQWIFQRFSHRYPLDELTSKLPLAVPAHEVLVKNSPRTPAQIVERIPSVQTPLKPHNVWNEALRLESLSLPSFLPSQKQQGVDKEKIRDNLSWNSRQKDDSGWLRVEVIIMQLWAAINVLPELPRTSVSRALMAAMAELIFHDMEASIKLHLEHQRASSPLSAEDFGVSRRKKRKLVCSPQMIGLEDGDKAVDPKEQSIAFGAPANSRDETSKDSVDGGDMENSHSRSPRWVKLSGLKGSGLWPIRRIIQRVCCWEFDNQRFPMMASWIFNLCKPVPERQRAGTTISPCDGSPSGTQRGVVEPLLPNLLFYLSTFVERWRIDVSDAVVIGLTLNLYEFCLKQLSIARRLLSLDVDVLGHSLLVVEADSSETIKRSVPVPCPPPQLVAYYNAICRETLVGRLLILCGIEPQFLLPSHLSPGTPRQEDGTFHPTRGALWLQSPEDRKMLRFPLVGVSILEELGLSEAPFISECYPISPLVLHVLEDIFLSLMCTLPTLWPIERLLSDEDLMCPPSKTM